MNEINFDWKGENRREINDPDEIWRNNYSKLKEYFNQKGNSDVPARHKEKSLGTWVVAQRVKRNDNKLEDWQIELLEKLNFNWKPKNTFEDFVEALKQFIDENGHARVPQLEKRYGNLGKRVTLYRVVYNNSQPNINGERIYKSTKLTDEQFQTLNELGFDWGSNKQNWDFRFEELLKYFKMNGHSQVTSQENSVLYNWINKQKIKVRKNELSDIQIELLKTINFNEVNTSQNEKIYEIKLSSLNEYFKEHGNFEIPKNDPKYSTLLNWLRSQRNRYLKNDLEEKYYLKIKKTGFPIDDFFKPVNDISWNENLYHLKEYYNKFNSFVIKSTDKSNRKLRSWLNYQNELYSLNKLEIDKVEKLHEIGFSFKQPNYDKLNSEKWYDLLSKFQKHYETTGSFFISRKNIESKELLSWINYQRTLKKLGKLLPERYESLTKIGYSFDINYYQHDITKKKNHSKPNKSTESWDSLYLQLINYKMEYGSCSVPARFQGNRTLANFVLRLRDNYRKGKLKVDEIKKLELIGFEWEVDHKQKYMNIWLERYTELVEVCKTNKTSNISKSSVNENLYTWILMQRMKYRKNELSDIQIKLLNDIKFDWNPESPVGSPDDDIWFAYLEQLSEYKTKFGDCNVSQLDVTYKKLGRWVNDQRLSFSRGKLPEHRKDLLEDIGIIWNIKEHDWQLRLESLKSFYEKYGHFDVKQSDKEFTGLYDWLYKMNRKGTTKARINKLSEIGYDTKNIKIQTD